MATYLGSVIGLLVTAVEAGYTYSSGQRSLENQADASKNALIDYTQQVGTQNYQSGLSAAAQAESDKKRLTAITTRAGVAGVAIAGILLAMILGRGK